MNKVILIGNIGSEVKSKTFDSGQTVVEFSLATSEKYKDKSGEKREDTTWHNIVIWGRLGEIVSTYCGKGSKLMIEGKIRNEQYEKDGVTKYVTKIVANNIEMLGGGNQNNQAQQPQQQQAQPQQNNQAQQPQQQAQPHQGDELPF